MRSRGRLHSDIAQWERVGVRSQHHKSCFTRLGWGQEGEHHAGVPGPASAKAVAHPVLPAGAVGCRYGWQRQLREQGAPASGLVFNGGHPQHDSIHLHVALDLAA